MCWKKLEECKKCSSYREEGYCAESNLDINERGFCYKELAQTLFENPQFIIDFINDELDGLYIVLEDIVGSTAVQNVTCVDEGVGYFVLEVIDKDNNQVVYLKYECETDELEDMLEWDSLKFYGYVRPYAKTIIEYR